MQLSNVGQQGTIAGRNFAVLGGRLDSDRRIECWRCNSWFRWRYPMRASDRAFHFRAIARSIIERVFEDGLPADEEAELITSITRQLLTNDGHAGLITGRGQFWVRVVQKPELPWEYGLNHVPEISVLRFMRDWDLDADLVPGILRRLTVAQSAEFTNRKGMRLRFWIDPKLRRTNIEPVTVESEP
jgi:hypothetical protein